MGRSHRSATVRPALAADALRPQPRAGRQAHCMGLLPCAQRIDRRSHRRHRIANRAIRARLSLHHPGALHEEHGRNAGAQRQSRGRRHRRRRRRSPAALLPPHVALLSHPARRRVPVLRVHAAWRGSPRHVRLSRGANRALRSRHSDMSARDVAPGAASRKEQILAVARVASGNLLEMYDFMVFGYYAPEIGRVFFPENSAFASLMLALLTVGVGFLMRPLGAIVLGAYIDRYGRRRGLILTLSLMGIGIVSI